MKRPRLGPHPARRLHDLLLGPIYLPLLALAALASRLVRRPRSEKPRLIWGPVPLLNLKYWSTAMRQAGFESESWVYPPASINRREDYDRILPGSQAGWRGALLAPLAWAVPYWAFVRACFAGDFQVLPYNGGFLGVTLWWRLEGPLLHLAGVPVAIASYGGDMYRYSQVQDPCLRHALLRSYPLAARTEEDIAARMAYWNRHAACVVMSSAIDGLSRWDAFTANSLAIDLAAWSGKAAYSPHDGRSGPVKVMHAPNHRGFKGTDVLLAAVERLRAEGLQVELLLLEGVPNDEVKRLMREEADLLAEQFVACGYGLNGIEGMASGLPVMANLADEAHTRVFRRHAFLNECPILSTTPEQLADHLRLLVTRPALREALGRAGQAYVAKYHGLDTGAYMFGAIVDACWHGRPSVDLMCLFDPLHSAWNRRLPPVDHPLVDGALPPEAQLPPALRAPVGAA